MSIRERSWVYGVTIALALGTGLLSAHCAEPNLPGDDLPTADAPPVRHDPPDAAAPDPGPEPGPDPGSTTPAPPSPLCTNMCTTVGAKRCASAGNAGTEICTKVDGCLAWVQGPDCQPDYACDKTANDGTCKAGCTSDPGCDATHVDQAQCVANGTAEQTCTKVGACYVFKTTRSSVPQQCNAGQNYCSAGQRVTCVTSPAGACTQHVGLANPCAANTACQGAGQCVPTCTNACTENYTLCSGNLLEVCKKGANGCTSWVASDNCATHDAHCATTPSGGGVCQACASTCAVGDSFSCAGTSSYVYCKQETNGCKTLLSGGCNQNCFIGGRAGCGVK